VETEFDRERVLKNLLSLYETEFQISGISKARERCLA
jgi:hypothetical protein